MPNLNQLIISSQTCSIILSGQTAGGIPFDYPLMTVTSFDFNDATEGELLYAIGSQDPIGNKQNANKYDGKITLQLGETFALLAAAGYTSLIQLSNCQLSVAALTGGFVKSYLGVNCNSDSSTIKAKDKETLVSTDWLALSLGV
jgi:hypothetical protein